jgi:hypothetical protein
LISVNDDWNHQGLAFRYALLLTVIEVAAFRGLIDLLFRRYSESPSLFGEESAELREGDIVARRRVAFWRSIWKLVRFGIVIITIAWIVLDFFGHKHPLRDTCRSRHRRPPRTPRIRKKRP